MAGIEIKTFEASFEGEYDYDLSEARDTKVVLRYAGRRVAEFPVDERYMDSDDMDVFVAGKFGELFAMLADYGKMTAAMKRKGI